MKNLKAMNRQISIRTLIFYAAIAVAILFFIDSCKRNFLGGLFGSKTDTLKVKTDTVWVAIQGDTVYVPEVQTVTHTNTFYKPIYRTDTLEISEVLPADTAAILSRFYQTAYYSDTISKRDTGLSKYGYIVVADSVSQNRITSRRLISNLKIPEVTNTITIQKNKIVLYAGVSAMGTLATPLYALGGDLSLKSRNGKIYTVGALTTKEGDMYYVAGFKVPIRLRKQK